MSYRDYESNPEFRDLLSQILAKKKRRGDHDFLRKAVFINKHETSVLELTDLVWNHGWTLDDFATEFETTPGEVRKSFVRYGIPEKR
jgi:hypothetical protein